MTRTGVLTVERASTIAEVERLLTKLRSAPEDCDLLLPKKLSNRYFCGVAAQMQLIATWRRKCPDGRLRVYANGPAGDAQVEAVVRNFVKTDHGLMAAALARGVSNRSGSAELTGIARSLVDDRLRELTGTTAPYTHGAHSFVPCLDDSPFAAPRCLYLDMETQEEGSALQEFEGFRHVVEEIDHRLWSGSGVRRPPIRVDGKSLASLVFELFKNTNDWARKNADEDPYRKRSSFRGLRAERHNFDVGTEAEMVEEQPALREYLERPELEPLDDRRRLIELTIFDSGPGIAARRLAQTGGEGIEAEHEALHDCLRKHFTTRASGWYHGKGLHGALRALSALSSFLWIRSGSLSLYRDFAAVPYEPERNPTEPFLLDWNTGIAGVVEMAPTAGTFVTALIPMLPDKRQLVL